MNMFAIVMLPVGFALSMVMCWRLLDFGRRKGWVDAVGVEQHKCHARPVPNLGGVAITAAVALPMLILLLLLAMVDSNTVAGVSLSLATHWPGLVQSQWIGWNLLLAMLVLHVVGVADDRLNLGPWLKLGVQGLLAVWLVMTCNLQVLTMLETWYGGFGQVASVAISAIWLVTVINAMNFMDNMDGLAGGVAAIITAAMLGVAMANGQWFVAATVALLLGAVLGFLLFNMPPARLFMGDGGSLVLGLLLGFVSIRLTYVDIDASLVPGAMRYMPLLMPLLWLAIPLYDLVSVSLIRIGRGRSPLRGDHNHLSHRLVRMNLGKTKAVGLIHLLTAITCMGALLVASASPVVSWLGAVIFGATLLGLLMLDLTHGTVQGPQANRDW